VAADETPGVDYRFSQAMRAGRALPARRATAVALGLGLAAYGALALIATVLDG
jgi:hypothetical protein